MGYLITLEGGEYTGKTSLLPSLAKILQDAGHQVKTSREPGGSPQAEEFRSFIFQQLRQGISAEEQVVLFNKARKMHINDVIRPYLGDSKEKNTILLVDRYLDSTRVYQGFEGGVQLEKIKEFENKYVNGFYPDLTLILFIPEERFTEIHHFRKQYTNFKQTHDRDIIPFDQSDISTQLQRQRYHLQLPELAKRFNEQRAFGTIDSSQDPIRIIEDSLRKISQFIPIISLDSCLEIMKKLDDQQYWADIKAIYIQQQDSTI
ncbi:dTMP kinase [Candidatus Roizmanbacteria bacterium RIFCSPLOWO2_02_FULL_37_19]|uniref:Thymidylate kinase n=1 Tax=Candidatus Roizmanbacteria bacterium RIFCSPHIGHO2_02_FULL_37_24 TaxID=1802037 RepID=A0A1F7GW00_9BACT|nr:MAG: dTMP kinase [Candidatus Roizmanbacteria bacterium RIFCSPHIGHO2_01_FULL_38_41]OGK22944.1 MAG: dTMP kinase [Candidatus Roizmanbacteria bacterium RIFCSPHIGHO2_02_FULL_37_24]OGK33602.1 MAG: dTMP kinase [Candidatus Roizmanbacteria bacterium RIFCSPHIGHO2_12_FULL_37_23]OGK44193.1 MAG: dTMP kinase [Candidatus Roizmanbacteria bacterium RIFCSPLOWO2_01_FULL_37_57]OGK55254.1 MAG: dTMP kinase [Candidatus Roizmanbacteria bacterium RIFCSPLOWO2_02_FULL_37_19]